MSSHMNLSGTALSILLLIFFLLGLAFGAWLARLLIRYPFGRNPITGREALIGTIAIVTSIRDGLIEAKAGSQIWRVTNMNDDELRIGDRVIVRSFDNLTLLVEKEQ